MVSVGTGTGKSRFLKTKWPFTEGLIAGTTKLPAQNCLKPEISNVSDRDKVGL
jgi:hypothetical protein